MPSKIGEKIALCDGDTGEIMATMVVGEKYTQSTNSWNAKAFTKLQMKNIPGVQKGVGAGSG